MKQTPMSRKKRSRKKPKNRRYGQGDSDSLIRSRQGADQKMSEVLLDFIEPYRQFANTDEAMERLVVMGITAWNVSLLPEHKRDTMLTELAAAALSGGSLVRRIASRVRTAIFGQSRDVADFKQIVYEMVERKLQHYAENRRFIANYKLSQTKDDIHLFVVSTLTPVP